MLRRGRWEIHATYPTEQRRVAIRDAKSLDRISTISGAKVIREFKAKRTGSNQEQVLYMSPRLEKLVQEEKRGAGVGEAISKGMSLEVMGGVSDPAKRGVSTSASAPSAASINGKVSDSKRTSSPPTEVDVDQSLAAQAGAGNIPISAVALLVRLLFVTVVAMLIALSVAGVLSIILSNSTTFSHSLSQGGRNNLLFGVFIGTFLLSAFPLAIKYVSRLSARATYSPPVRPQRSKRPRNPRSDDVAPTPAPQELVISQSDKLSDGFEAVAGETVEAVRDMAQRLSEALKGGISLDPRSYLPNMLRINDLMPKRIKAAADVINGFMKQSKSFMDDAEKPVDNVTRFGISLFLAGTVEIIAKEQSLSDADKSLLLSHAVQDLGFGKNQADNFAAKFDDYLLADPRYLQMYQHGRDAMTMDLGGEVASSKMLNRALDDWNAPKASQPPSASQVVTVMFTDMVGSTNMTETLGDEGAQKMVRLHNRIVRDALTKKLGREVKHTGDGIMASFENASNGIEAAIMIQESLAESHRQEPDLPLQIKIGINAGEAIMEDDDIFGSTVQIAARLADKAQAGEIIISSLVQGLCSGKKIAMTKRGPANLKGVSDPVDLFEVLWGDKKLSPATSATTKDEEVADPSSPEASSKNSSAPPAAADGI